MKRYKHLLSALIVITSGSLLFSAHGSSIQQQATEIDGARENISNKFISFSMLKESELDMKQLPPKYPEKLSTIDNKEVTIVGFMTPVDQVKNIKHFLLVAQQQGCFFCDTPMTLLDMVYVKLDENKTTSILDEAVKVTGTLKLLSGTTPLSKRKGGVSNQMVYSLVNATITKANQNEIKQYTVASKSH